MRSQPIVIAVAVVLLAACGGKTTSSTTTRRTVEAGDGVLLDEAGQLAEGDLRVGRGFADHYEVAVREGDRVSVQLDATAFDPLLEVVPPDGEPLVNDDWRGDRQRSRIDLVAAAAGVLKVRVTSYSPGATGAYRVRVERTRAPTEPGAPDGRPPSAPQAVAMLGAGQSMQGELTETDAVLPDGSFYDQVVIDVAQGQPLVLRVTPVEGTPPRVEVMNPGGQALRASAPGVFPLVEAGVHRVLIAGTQPAQRGRYGAEVRAATGGQEPVALQREHHRAPQGITATDVQLGQQVAGSLTANDARLPSGETADVYRLQGRADTRLALEMSSSDLDSYLLVIGPGGRHWENDDSGGTVNAALGFALPADGVYQIVATSYRAGETGSYQLKVFADSRVVTQTAQPPSAPPTAAPTASAAIRRTGTLAAGDTQLDSGELADRYNFVWQAGQRVRIGVTSTEFDTYVIVVSPSGHQTDNDDVAAGDTNSLIEHEVTETGPHRVIVTSYQPGETGSYELRIEPVGGAQVAAGPRPVPPPTQAASGWRTIAGSLAPGDRTLRSGEFFDTHEMQWPAGHAVRLEARSSEFDTYLIVQPPEGDQQDNDDQAPGNTNAALDLVTSRAGVYRVLVTSYRAGEQGAYELLVGTPGGTVAQPTQPTQPAQPAQPTGAGREITGALAQGDQTLRSGELSDSHTVNLEAGRSVRIRLASTEFDPYLIVRTPSGRQIENDDFESGSLDSGIDVPRTEAGDYVILATSYRPGETGRYALRIENGPPVVGPAVSSGSTAASSGGGRVFGVFAGITDYPAGVGDLPECANDAIKLAETLRQAGLLTEDRQALLTDSRATRANIRQAMARMAQQVGPDDLFVFFYSGHGGRRPGSRDVREIDGADEYLVAYDGELLDDEMGQLFDGIHARVAVLALDACFAGGFAKDVITVPGRIGLFSSEEDVTSAVAGAFQAGGYLSHFLRTGIAGEADADPRDGVLTVGELTHYLTLQFGRHVREVRMSEGYQHLVVDRGAVRTSQVLWAYR